MLPMSVVTAQVPPPPPPPPPPMQNPDVGTPNTTHSPSREHISMEVLTSRLTEGKGIIRVRIVHSFVLVSVRASYIHEGKVITIPLIHEKDEIYKGLVEVQTPSSIIFFDIIDERGNHLHDTKRIEVSENQSLLNQIFGWFKDLFNNE